MENRDAVEREEERRIRQDKPAYTKEYRARLEYYLSRIPYKLPQDEVFQLHPVFWSPEKAGLGYRNR